MHVTLFSQESQRLFEEKYDESQSLIYDDPEKAIEIGMEAYRVAENLEDTWAMAIAKYGMGFISYEVGDFKSSYSNYLSALETLERADTVDLYNKMRILTELALIQSEFNNHDGAIEFYDEALSIAKIYAQKHPKHARDNDQMGWLMDIPYYTALEYQSKGAHQTAGKILFNLWEEAENKDDVRAYAQVLNELGIIKSKNGEYSLAQEYLGIVISSPEVANEYKSAAYHNLAGTYMNQGEFEKARNYYIISMDLAQEVDDPRSEYITLVDIGELELKDGNTLKAIQHWEAAIETYEDINTSPELYSVYNWLQLAYMDVDVEKAKEYNLKYTALNDFYVKNQTEQRELEAQNRQELSTWIDQQRQKRVDAEQRQRFVQQFWPVFVGVGLILLFSIFLGIRYYRTVRANKLLTQQQMGFQRVSARDKAA